MAARREAVAGLAVLRFLDRIRVGVSREQWPTAPEFRRVRLLVADMGHGAGLRDTLAGVLEALAEACAGRAFTATRLLAYARTLLNDGRWAQAADVYQTFIARAATPQDFLLVPEAYQRLAYALRMQGHLEGAAAACRTGRAVATSLGDVAVGLRLRIDEAAIIKHRGNLPTADALLVEIVAAAEQHGLPLVRAHAVHARAVIAYERGQPQQAVAQLYEVWQAYTEPVNKDRALADIAVALADLGLRDAARNAFLILSATAIERETRVMAMLNLMEIAARDGQETVFQQYRRDIAAHRLSPRLEAHFLLMIAEGLERLRRPAAARAAFAAAETFATEHEVNLVRFRAEAAARALAGRALAAPPPPPPPLNGVDDPRLAQVVQALQVATTHARAP